MGGPFHEPAYPALSMQDFGTGSQYRAATYKGNRTVVIGAIKDPMLAQIPNRVQPAGTVVDVAIHGLPGRFIEAISDPQYEIPASVIVELLQSLGIPRGAPLRLLTCHAAEPPMRGPTAARMLAAEWGGPITAPNGILRVLSNGSLRVDLVDWETDPLNPGRMRVDAVQPGHGTFVTVR
jgi:hypothetical protein